MALHFFLFCSDPCQFLFLLVDEDLLGIPFVLEVRQFGHLRGQTSVKLLKFLKEAPLLVLGLAEQFPLDLKSLLQALDVDAEGPDPFPGLVP